MGEATLALKGFRRERGLLWPDYDRRCAEVSFGEIEDALPEVLKHVSGRRAVIQAGGNCGQMAIQLAAVFDAVYSFEPDGRNFIALTVNTAHLSNVFRYQAALGLSAQTRGVQDGDSKFPGANCGALYMSGEGQIPDMHVDCLRLKICDLILLDIEGGEYDAIRSAGDTIDQCRPVIVIEDKGLGARFYGEDEHAAERWLISWHGYRRAARVKNDTVMVPA